MKAPHASPLSEPIKNLINDLAAFIPDTRLITDPLRTLAYGTDASFYRLIPQLVVRVESEEEVRQLLRAAQAHGTAVTFRAAGTSLSGQAVTDSVLMVLGQNWNGHLIEDQGNVIRLQPGVIGAQANRYLAPYQRKIGPDPASINAAKIGGIAANNASGMCCGTAQNSFRTLKAMKLILADGTLLDSNDPDSITAFRQSHRGLLDALGSLADLTRSNPQLSQRIAHKYRLKNTTGYALNALIEFDDPIEILQHLMIGSEGTLGFIAEITYHTVAELPHKASALIYFDQLNDACEAVALLKQQPVAAVELIDRAGLRSIEEQPGIDSRLRDLPHNAAALLVETRAEDAALLQAQLDVINATLAPLATSWPVEFTSDPVQCAQFWAIRKGLFPAVGAVRSSGTTVIIEDIAVPVPRLAEAVADLHRIFQHWDYTEALIFGHALEGNLHFVFTQAFDNQQAVDRYAGLMDAVADLVVNKYDGSLKAEHGTGRNMAPYVELEWGTEAYRLMWQLKSLLDPHNLLNPGVILNRDPQVHLQDLKPLPATNPLVDKCIECGFCEPSCPSRALTLTPRQRIVVRREIARLARSGEDPTQLQSLHDAYEYQGNETCAACGLCATACPIGINTGDLTRQLRQVNAVAQAGKARWLAGHFSTVTRLSTLLLKAADSGHAVLGSARMSKLTGGLRQLSGQRIPLWTPAMPTAAKPIRPAPSTLAPTQPQVVYLPSCASRTMGPQRGADDSRSLVEITETLLRRAGFDVLYPAQLDNLCCGMPFQSKGQFDAADSKTAELNEALLQVTEHGRIPVYSDTSPCSLRLQGKLDPALQVYDSLDFIAQHVLDELTLTPVEETIALHVTCSATRMGQTELLTRIAQRCASRVVIPEQISCCGFAGDKGFTTPELNASALRTLRSQVSDCHGGYSTSRTCEIGLSYHSGLEYRSILYLLERCSQPRQDRIES